MKRLALVVGMLGATWWLSGFAPPVVDCPCDHAQPETLKARVCGLCRTAEEQTTEFYFLKDINPHKPNRHLALPKAHGRGLQTHGSLPSESRIRYWEAAIGRAKQLYPDRWGLAVNGYFFRTQCHAHIHVGPLSPEVEDVGGRLYDHPSAFPSVGPEQGLWIHPRDGRYCVHRDRDLAEVVLVR